uniref:Uncharacterized protein n=1 Tax=Scleropages formosus TaxID=113540 RepID=A0A8C9S8M9_SCLFO
YLPTWFDQCSSVHIYSCTCTTCTFYSISFLLVVVYAYESKRVAQGWRESSAGGESEVHSTSLSITGLCLRFSLTVGWVLTWIKQLSNNFFSCLHSCILLLHIRNDTCSHVVTLVAPPPSQVVYSKVSSWFRGYEERATLPMEGDSFSRRRLRGLCATARSMVLVVTFCWTPVLALVVLSFVQSISQETLFPLYVIQALGVSLHGLLNSIVYGWRRRNFRDAARAERTPLLEKPFFEESLTAN